MKPGCYICRPDDPNVAEEGCADCDQEFAKTMENVQGSGSPERNQTHFYGDGCESHPKAPDLQGVCERLFPKCCSYHEGWVDGWLAHMMEA